MKKVLIILLGVLLMFNLFGCGKKKDIKKENEKSFTIEIINEFNETDIWVISDTEENRKTTVWGKATISGIKLDGKEKVSISCPKEIDTFIINIIDINGMYYSVKEVKLEEGSLITLSNTDDLLEIKAIVSAKDGKETEYIMHGGKL